LQSGDSFEVVVEYIWLFVDEGLKGFSLPPKIGYQGFDGYVGTAGLDGVDGVDKSDCAPVVKVVASDRGKHHVGQTHSGDRFRDSVRFLLVTWFGSSGVD
tara:strand:+ start:2151 stop:2450 length:300 start_codon:yes stop_codon:yes gene_type:complete